MIEGGSSKDYTRTRKFYGIRKLFIKLINKLTNDRINSLEYQYSVAIV